MFWTFLNLFIIHNRNPFTWIHSMYLHWTKLYKTTKLESFEWDTNHENLWFVANDLSHCENSYNINSCTFPYIHFSCQKMAKRFGIYLVYGMSVWFALFCIILMIKLHMLLWHCAPPWFGFLHGFCFFLHVSLCK